jgi:hypothetical protein
MGNKYAEELEKEKELLIKDNPFNKKQETKTDKKEKTIRSLPYVEEKDSSTNYFSLILSSDFRDLEMEIRGLRYYKEIDKNGREIITTKRIEGHYLSEQGADDLLLELKAHLSSDIKLGVMTRDEHLQQNEIIRKFLHSYLMNNLYKLGMDTEEKQRKAPTLFTMMMARIRSVYSRSIAGLENRRSHGDIKLSGELDMQKEDRFKLEDMKN